MILYFCAYYYAMDVKILFFSFLLWGCTVVPLANQYNHTIDASWKNPKYNYFKPSKILVLAICNFEDRVIFEESFNYEFKQRGLISNSCYKKYHQLFSISLKSAKELELFDEKLLMDGYDAVFVVSIKGVEKQLDYKKDYYKIYHEWYRFDRYFNYNQDAIIFPYYYGDYKYYNLENSLYMVNRKKDKTIVWAGIIKIIDPLKINQTIHQYSKTVLKELEQQQIIPNKSS